MASEAKANDIKRALARGEQGLVDPVAEHKNRPFKEHLADYLADLRAKGRSAKYVQNLEKRLTKLSTACGWTTLTSITADSFMRWRQGIQLLDDGRPAIGPVTMNQYLEASFGFCRWLVKPGKRMPANPLADVDRVDESSDIHARTAFF